MPILPVLALNDEPLTGCVGQIHVDPAVCHWATARHHCGALPPIELRDESLELPPGEAGWVVSGIEGPTVDEPSQNTDDRVSENETGQQPDEPPSELKPNPGDDRSSGEYGCQPPEGRQQYSDD